MRAPDDQGEAALLAVVGAGVARAAAEAGEAVAAKAATKFAAACSSAAKGTEAGRVEGRQELCCSRRSSPTPRRRHCRRRRLKRARRSSRRRRPSTVPIASPGRPRRLQLLRPPRRRSLSLAEVNKFTVPKLKAALKERTCR